MGLRRICVIVVAVFSSEAALSAGDADRGAREFNRCLPCHALEAGHHLTGPSLHGIIGRKSAGVTEFERYSDALAGADLTWNETNLDRFLANPAALVPGNRMSAAVPDAQIRADIIAYLKALQTPGGANNAGFPVPQPNKLDIKSLGPASRVASVALCRDAWRVTLENGTTLPFWERNLEFKTDSSALGPDPGKPALVQRGREGDRAFIIFAEPAEIGALLRSDCGAAKP